MPLLLPKGDGFGLVTPITVFAMLFKVREMQVQLRIPTEHLVRGDLLVQNEADARLDMMAEDEERIEAR